MHQKLVAIYLAGLRDTAVQEHLGDYLRHGWVITEVHPLGSGGGDCTCVSGWIVVSSARMNQGAKNGHELVGKAVRCQASRREI